MIKINKEKGLEDELTKEEIDNLKDLLGTFGLIKGFLNEQVIQDLSNNSRPILKLINGLISTDLTEVLERALQDPEVDKALLDPPKIGLFGLMRALRDEEVQKGMGILINLIKAIGKSAEDVSDFEDKLK